MSSRLDLRSFLVVAAVIAAVRLGAFLVLLVLEATGRQTLASVPLVFLLYPEGLLLAHDVTWTGARPWLFAVLLVSGSAVLAVPVTLLLGVVRTGGAR